MSTKKINLRDKNGNILSPIVDLNNIKGISKPGVGGQVLGLQSLDDIKKGSRVKLKDSYTKQELLDFIYTYTDLPDYQIGFNYNISNVYSGLLVHFNDEGVYVDTWDTFHEYAYQFAEYGWVDSDGWYDLDTGEPVDTPILEIPSDITSDDFRYIESLNELLPITDGGSFVPAWVDGGAGGGLPDGGKNGDVLTKTIIQHTFTPGVTWRFKNSYTQEELEAISGNRIYGPEGYSDYIFTGSGEGPNYISYMLNSPDSPLTYSIEAGGPWKLNYSEEVEAPTMIVPDWFTEDKFKGADFDLFINTLFVSEGREEKLEWKPGLPEYGNDGEVLTVVTESGGEAEFDKEMSFKDSYSLTDYENILTNYIDPEDYEGYIDLLWNNDHDMSISFEFYDFPILMYWYNGVEYGYLVEEFAVEAGWYQRTDGGISKVETPKIVIPSDGTYFTPYADGSTPTISDFTILFENIKKSCAWKPAGGGVTRSEYEYLLRNIQALYALHNLSMAEALEDENNIQISGQDENGEITAVIFKEENN